MQTQIHSKIMQIENKKRTRKHSFLPFGKPIPSDDDGVHSSDQVIKISKPGWKAMPYILGMEAMERLGSYGMTANLMVYLVKEFHMHQVEASNVINIWDFACNFLPIIGAIIADIYIGKFLTIALGAFASLLGMVIIILTASVPQLRPPLCATEQQELAQCISPTQIQQAILLIGLFLMSIGAGGIRPCSIPFGVDQFDTNTPEGKRESNGYYNWYYTLVTLVMLIDQTLVVYIQVTISWALGFSLPAVLMLCAIILFFVGRKFYVCLSPEGSNISGIVQVFLAALRKRKLKLPTEVEARTRFFDPPLEENHEVSKLSLSTNLRFLNKAALVEDTSNEVKSDGTCANPWKLCSIQQVEEVKHIVKLTPIWASGIICFVATEQQATFTVSQALKMDRHIGANYQIPAGSMNVISLITIAIWLPVYDRLLQPAFRKLTKTEEGITILQRIGIGYISSVICMVVAGFVERKRRAFSTDGVEPLSAFWLAPQLVFIGLCQVLVIVGHTELYNREFPERMRSIGTSMVLLNNSAGSYLSSLIVNIVHHVTRKNGQPDWLTNDINFGRLDYFYFLLGGIGMINFVYFVFCSRGYRYK